MSMFEVWVFFVMLPNIGVFVKGVLTVTFILLAGYALFMVDYIGTYDNAKKKIWVSCKLASTSILICSFLLAIIPSKKEVAAIVLIPYATNNPEFKKLPENLAKHLNNLMKEYLPDGVKDEK